MKCSRCGSEMKIKNVKVDTDIHGNPIYNKYAYCYTCKIKRNLGQLKAQAKRSHKRKRKKGKLVVALILILLLIIGIGTFFFIKNLKEKQSQNESTVVTPTGNNKISTDSYEQLETGMTYDEVKSLIGNAGNKLLQVTSDENSAERYQWITKDGEGTVLLSFEDGNLISISQAGMETGGSVSLSDEVKKEIKSDMSYKEVTSVLGEKGVLLSETLQNGTTSKLYEWKDSNSGKSFSIVFVEDKLRSYNFNDKKTEQ